MNLINQGSARTRNLKINVVGSSLLKGICILISLLLVPLTINYVNPTQYGIWLTLSSIIGWVEYFDLGLCLGFKNRFAECVAKSDVKGAQQYVSTTYVLMAITFFIVGVISYTLNQFVNWSQFINVSDSYSMELKRVFDVLIVCFCASMVAKIVCTMLEADQCSFVASLINMVAQILKLIVIYVMTLTVKGNLLNLSIAFSLIPVVVMFLSTFIIFRSKKYRRYAPTINGVHFSLTHRILSLGIQFFMIMIAMLFIFQMINVLISRNLGAEVVTQYNIAYKYFSIVYMGFMIILTPYWAAFTDAYTKHDIKWMKKAAHSIEVIFLLSSIALLIMLFVADYVYKLWVDSSIHIPFVMSLSVAIYILSNVFGVMYMIMINGIGTVRLQTIIYVAFAIVAIPLMNSFSISYGIMGLLVIPSLTFLVQAIVGRMQLYRLINGTAHGIWKK